MKRLKEEEGREEYRKDHQISLGGAALHFQAKAWWSLERQKEQTCSGALGLVCLAHFGRWSRCKWLGVGDLNERAVNKFAFDWRAVGKHCWFASIDPVASDHADEANGTRGFVRLPPPKIKFLKGNVHDPGGNHLYSRVGTGPLWVGRQTSPNPMTWRNNWPWKRAGSEARLLQTTEYWSGGCWHACLGLIGR